MTTEARDSKCADCGAPCSDEELVSCECCGKGFCYGCINQCSEEDAQWRENEAVCDSCLASQIAAGHVCQCRDCKAVVCSDHDDGFVVCDDEKCDAEYCPGCTPALKCCCLCENFYCNKHGMTEFAVLDSDGEDSQADGVWICTRCREVVAKLRGETSTVPAKDAKEKH